MQDLHSKMAKAKTKSKPPSQAVMPAVKTEDAQAMIDLELVSATDVCLPMLSDSMRRLPRKMHLAPESSRSTSKCELPSRRSSKK